MADISKKDIEDFLTKAGLLNSKDIKELSDRIYTYAIDIYNVNDNMAKVLSEISHKTQARKLEMDDLESGLKRYKDMVDAAKISLVQLNEERKRGLKVDEQEIENNRKLLEQSQKSAIAAERALAFKKLEQEQALSDADYAYHTKLENQVQSGKITQEQYDIKMSARYGKNYDSTSGANFEDYRQKQLGRADTIINIAQGSGYTGLSGAADMGISALSKAGPYGAIAAAVLKVVKAGVENILSRMDAAYKLLANNIDAGNDILKEQKGIIDTRLQGLENQFGDSGSSFKDIVNTLFANATNSATINQKAYIENISKLVDSGVAYNLEERALLMTVSDKIATTFEALDKNLERLIRLQQADITASQLGSEASLTAFFNRQFNDTSYLSDEYDNVNATLLEASAQMNIDQATSFMYSAQKWLGSLYSLGLSSGAVNTIAQGLALLSTGNVNQLGGNQQLQTMMAMAAQNAGLSYSSILTGGLDANSVDALLASMVKYLGQIANNTSGNQVVKSQWADILGLSVSDFRAISNLTQGDLDAILAQGNMGFEGARNTVTDLMGSSTFFNRYSAQELVGNILENALFSKGMSISLDPAAATQYLLQGFHESLMGDGSIIEKFGIWLSNTMRAASVDALSELDYVNPMLTAAMMGGSTTFGEWNSKLYDKLAESQLGAAGNYTDKWWLNGLINIGTGNLAALYNLAYGSVIQDAGSNAAAFAANSNYIRNTAFGQQMSMLDLSRWGSTLYNQNRGQGFQGLTPTALGLAADLTNLALYENPFIQSTSVSSTGGSTLAERVVTSFDNVQEAVESSANAVTSINEETTDSMEKLYHALFEEQAVPIKVYIDGLSDELVEKIDIFYDKNNLDLSDAIANAISTNSSISSMISTIQYLKGV